MMPRQIHRQFFRIWGPLLCPRGNSVAYLFPHLDESLRDNNLAAFRDHIGVPELNLDVLSFGGDNYSTQPNVYWESSPNCPSDLLQAQGIVRISRSSSSPLPRLF
jgi:hypothetical protein